MPMCTPNTDGGTTEIWIPAGLGSHDLGGVVGTFVTGSGHSAYAVEHWLVFKDTVGNLHGSLKPFPAGLPPFHAVTAHSDPVKFQASDWNFHDDGADPANALTWAQFRDAALAKIEKAYELTAGSLRNHCRGFQASWDRKVLVAENASGPNEVEPDDLVSAEHPVGGVKINRVFRVKKSAGGALLGRIYAEQPDGNSRVVHQYADDNEGIVENNGSKSHYKLHADPETLADFLQDKLDNHQDWHFSTGTVTHLPTV